MQGAVHYPTCPSSVYVTPLGLLIRRLFMNIALYLYRSHKMNRAEEDDQIQSACPELQCTYPLCLPRAETDSDDLHRQHEDLIRRAPEIFAVDETGCSIELRQYSRESPRELGGKLGGGYDADVGASTTLSHVHEAGKLTLPEAISTVESLRAVLLV